MDGFCLDFEAMDNGLPDCIDAKYTPELKYLKDHKILTVQRKQDFKPNCDTYGWYDAGDYHHFGCIRKYANVNYIWIFYMFLYQ